jgi:hypothetical protein
MKYTVYSVENFSGQSMAKRHIPLLERTQVGIFFVSLDWQKQKNEEIRQNK